MKKLLKALMARIRWVLSKGVSTNDLRDIGGGH